MSTTQNLAIRRHLNSGKGITSLAALRKFGCFRLAARIYDLEKSGMSIEHLRYKTPSGKHCVSYRRKK